jgi:predicted Zn finger-like uncharacterized protein
MSLATRCSACGTVFRVVQDQLKVSEGWVRCGRCKEVFNALEALFDLEREAPPQWKPPPGAPGSPGASSGTSEPRVPETAGMSADPPSREDDTHDGPAVGDAFASSQATQASADALAEARHEADGVWAERAATDPATPSPAAATSPAAAMGVATAVPSTPAAVDEGDSVPEDPRDFADARFNADFALDDETDAASPATQTAAIAGPSPDEAPAFLREAPARPRGHRPAVRAGLAALAALLVLLLAGQAAYHLRDEFAARWPQTRPALATLCGWLDCRIEAPRRIDDISVESSSLTLANPGGAGDAMRLSLALRNHGDVPLAAPMVDLALTDGNGRVLSRRALGPADFRRDGLVLPPGSETQLELLLSTGPQRAAGYTVEIFYP